MIYVVSYSLRPKRDPSDLVEALKESPGWAHYLDDTWFVSTRENAEQLYTRIFKHMKSSDNLLIIEFTENADYQGWLSKKAWAWLKRKRGQ